MTEAETPIIEVRNLRTAFGRPPNEAVIHDGLSFTMRRGEILGVVGGSGTGKSVLLKEIVGLIRPAGGEIRVFGVGHEEIRNSGGNPYAENPHCPIRRRWGVLFQDGALFTSLTVRENIMLPILERTDLPRASVAELARVKISLVGLPGDAGEKYPWQLSGGMRKRAGLARALALDPELVFLDEPTAGLDPIGAAAFDELIRDLQQSLGLSVFLVTHDLDTLHAVCDRIAVLIDRNIRVATLDALLEDPHPWIRNYFHGPRGRAVQPRGEDKPAMQEARS